ncbi:MAG: CerR family C-terminal domain-containing protein [Alphaproteobacteria bacterium]|jgi:hypothetical protein|nr:CerR family C-terminal domain-containing protein [Alphaproteobacteria bacterium]MDP6516454.1 CerR family C-terminal domain-containing protein [Alphaproteobacteria bacterium]
MAEAIEALLDRLREDPRCCREGLFEAVFHPLYVAFLDLVVAATGRERGAAETRILTGALLGECLVFHRDQPIVPRSLGWDDYPPDGIAAITRTVTAGILDALDLPTGARDKD